MAAIVLPQQFRDGSIAYMAIPAERMRWSAIRRNVACTRQFAELGSRSARSVFGRNCSFPLLVKGRTNSTISIDAAS
jgi:hypothetical protein